MLNLNDLIQGDLEDPATQIQAGDDDHYDSSSEEHNSPSSTHMEITDPNNMFAALPSQDVDMTNQSSSSCPNTNIEQICSDLQNKLKLNPEHLAIALIGSKAPPEARHASLVFTNGAYHQINYQDNSSQKAGFAYGNTFRDFVRASARMLLLKPTLEAYSNNPHQNGEIPKTLFYLTLDAVEKQPDAWKTDHLPTSGLRDDPDVLNRYREVIGELLKYQRSNLRTLLLADILVTKKKPVVGVIPNRGQLLALIYEELPPKSSKLNESEIKHQVRSNFAMRARMCYARLVMVHYYIHRSKKESQWVEIDERLGILRGSSFDFQKKHADLVLQKDAALFSHKKKFCELSHADLTIPTLEDVRNELAATYSPVLNE
ncbi:uncharacterized protein PGTG_19425 [Puccinia graminis f. sp. tritici CRL 75-36-700-3]|uniref:Uncharacterized protein n=1 Tax=Puccinia graminis f. sp. tritici (strain CRL 75-36-700-3 / race SCCL) TaxID=418459 RepID=E3L9G1_PUCGT|nr:uncharacterized protein PGTG_19425 [Puccinia graminis f. sp. tritici CRL 75-36-700-3]EFP93186.2 hypothetical protein PGTG_19425 [Puccinia graminis f. sp. tritici CRL 75-36-700-3]